MDTNLVFLNVIIFRMVSKLQFMAFKKSVFLQKNNKYEIQSRRPGKIPE